MPRCVRTAVIGNYTFEFDDKDWGPKRVKVDLLDLSKVRVKWANHFVVTLDSGKVTPIRVPSTGYIKITETKSRKPIYSHGTPPQQVQRSTKLVTA